METDFTLFLARRSSSPHALPLPCSHPIRLYKHRSINDSLKSITFGLLQSLLSSRFFLSLPLTSSRPSPWLHPHCTMPTHLTVCLGTPSTSLLSSLVATALSLHRCLPGRLQRPRCFRYEFMHFCKPRRPKITSL
jgi:hypothetical protein